MACQPTLRHLLLDPAADPNVMNSDMTPDGRVEYWYDPEAWESAMKDNSLPILTNMPQSRYSISWSLGRTALSPAGGHVRFLNMTPEVVDNVMVSMNLNVI